MLFVTLAAMCIQASCACLVGTSPNKKRNKVEVDDRFNQSEEKGQ
jgi:hypothetical protein